MGTQTVVANTCGLLPMHTQPALHCLHFSVSHMGRARAVLCRGTRLSSSSSRCWPCRGRLCSPCHTPSQHYMMSGREGVGHAPSASMCAPGRIYLSFSVVRVAQRRSGAQCTVPRASQATCRGMPQESSAPRLPCNSDTHSPGPAKCTHVCSGVHARKPFLGSVTPWNTDRYSTLLYGVTESQGVCVQGLGRCTAK